MEIEVGKTYLTQNGRSERKSGWLNWYGTDNGLYIYRTRNDAELGALSGRTHVLEIITEDGKPVDVKIHEVTQKRAKQGEG